MRAWAFGYTWRQVLADDSVYTLDVYYHPADEDTMQSVATGIMDGFAV